MLFLVRLVRWWLVLETGACPLLHICLYCFRPQCIWTAKLHKAFIYMFCIYLADQSIDKHRSIEVLHHTQKIWAAYSLISCKCNVLLLCLGFFKSVSMLRRDVPGKYFSVEAEPTAKTRWYSGSSDIVAPTTEAWRRCDCLQYIACNMHCNRRIACEQMWAHLHVTACSLTSMPRKKILATPDLYEI